MRRSEPEIAVVASAPSRPLRGSVNLASTPVTGATRAMNDDRAKPTLDVWTLLGIGAYNVACLLVGMGVGWLIDSQLGTSPALLMVGLVGGIGLGVAGTWRRIRPIMDD